MSDVKKAEGRTLWNTPAGSTPSSFADLDVTALARLTPEDFEELRRTTNEKLDNDPVYQSFKRGLEASRRLHDPTVYWNQRTRDGRRTR